jgi:hypothetical protein
VLASAPLGGLLLLGCGSNAPAPARPAAAITASPAASGPAAPAASTKSTCEARPDRSGDLLVRVITNGQPAVTQQLGGAWAWDRATGTCDTAVQMIISAAPAAAAAARSCSQVARAADNRGYQLSAVPAPPLKKVIAWKGRAC